MGLTGLADALLQLLFPHLCVGCGDNLSAKHAVLCSTCQYLLPETGFESKAGNPVERKFWGRIRIRSASATCWFNQGSLMQHLMHQFKYKGERELCVFLGRMMGSRLAASGRFKADALVPLPLSAPRERKRGFNQAKLLCEGISAVTGVPVEDRVLQRNRDSSSQTSMGRQERWENMQENFSLTGVRPSGHRLLLVDDVVTTGATLEACATELLKIEGVEVSIAGLCYASRV